MDEVDGGILYLAFLVSSGLAGLPHCPAAMLLISRCVTAGAEKVITNMKDRIKSNPLVCATS
jgi:hypothetical protein